MNGWIDGWMDGRQAGRQTGLVFRAADTHLALVKTSLNSNEAFIKNKSYYQPLTLAPHTTARRSCLTLHHSLATVILAKPGNGGKGLSQPIGVSGISVPFPKGALVHHLSVPIHCCPGHVPGDTAALCG